MTSINLAVQPKRRAAYLITDAAWTSPQGTILRIASKTIEFNRFPCALTLSGRCDIFLLGAEIQKFDPRNVRTLVKILPDCVRRAMAATEAAAGLPAGTAQAIINVAAYSAREKRPIGYIMLSDPDLAGMIAPDLQAFEVTEAANFTGCEPTPTEIFGRACELNDEASFDPHEQAFALIEAHRRAPQIVATRGCDETIQHRVGGHVELIEVTRHGVKVWNCGSFPDVVGEKIDPATDPVPARAVSA